MGLFLRLPFVSIGVKVLPHLKFLFTIVVTYEDPGEVCAIYFQPNRRPSCFLPSRSLRERCAGGTPAGRGQHPARRRGGAVPPHLHGTRGGGWAGGRVPTPVSGVRGPKSWASKSTNQHMEPPRNFSLKGTLASRTPKRQEGILVGIVSQKGIQRKVTRVFLGHGFGYRALSTTLHIAQIGVTP